MSGSERQETPRVWALVSNRAGDDAQSEVIAQALGWPCEVKRMAFAGVNHFHHRIFGPSLRHVDLDASAPLTPPWPDLIVAAGRRQIAVALWIRKQSAGRCKLVQLGRPQVDLRNFDLVVATSQYRVPAAPNVVHLDLPLMRGGSRDDIAAAGEHWAPVFAGRPRPWTALMVGGPARPYRLDAEVAGRLIADAAGAVAGDGGTLFVTTSPRTPAAVADALEQGMPAGGCFHRWTSEPERNPYRGLLALADRFMVTGDSISMLVEVARLGKPLALCHLPWREAWRGRWRRFLNQTLYGPAGRARVGGGFGPAAGDLLHRLGLLSFTRDLGAFHHMLVERGMAVQLGEPFKTPAGPAPDELSLVTARIRALFNGRPEHGGAEPACGTPGNLRRT